MFKLLNKCGGSGARLAEMTTLHGTVPTPIFLPVGSQATVRSLTTSDLDEIGVRMVLCNAYHLYLRPGIDVIKKAGGLHRFMRWGGPILTDSGGYQVFSLSSFRKLTDGGVVFRSHIDGSEHSITPESAVSMQEVLGADIIMALDVCPGSGDAREKQERAMESTFRWAKRCRSAHRDNGQHLFGIIQGGIYPELRRAAAEQITSLDFPGYAIGGLSLGEPKTQMWEMVETTVQYMPADRPRYLMGVGSPEDIVEGISRGIDIFDSALPTRVARNGALYTSEGRKNIRRSAYREDMEPVEAGCRCFACRNYSAAYLHHLFKCEELLAYRLATIHNLFFMQKLIEQARNAIAEGVFPEFKKGFLESYKTTDEERRIEQKMAALRGKKSGDFT
ncbi:MAG: tRNA guanosine(34) transglycosylase Tgt [Chloroflexi bacterium]|nr:tRNA guanosine(34) transglycosylase Tgt [Chloroflexota bacterium]